MKKMLETLELAKWASEYENQAQYAYGNGEEITIIGANVKEIVAPAYEEIGYWLVAIFEHGHRVEA